MVSAGMEILVDTGAGSHLVSKGFDKQAAEIDPTPDTGMVTVTGQPLATGRKKRSVIQIGSGKFSIDYAEFDKVNFSVLREGCRKGDMDSGRPRTAVHDFGKECKQNQESLG